MADISQATYSNVISWLKNMYIVIQISQKNVTKGPFGSKLALSQAIVWHIQATSHYLNQ